MSKLKTFNDWLTLVAFLVLIVLPNGILLARSKGWL